MNLSHLKLCNDHNNLISQDFPSAHFQSYTLFDILLVTNIILVRIQLPKTNYSLADFRWEFLITEM